MNLEQPELEMGEGEAEKDVSSLKNEQLPGAFYRKIQQPWRLGRDEGCMRAPPRGNTFRGFPGASPLSFSLDP